MGDICSNTRDESHLHLMMLSRGIDIFSKGDKWLWIKNSQLFFLELSHNRIRWINFRKCELNEKNLLSPARAFLERSCIWMTPTCRRKNSIWMSLSSSSVQLHSTPHPLNPFLCSKRTHIESQMRRHVNYPGQKLRESSRLKWPLAKTMHHRPEKLSAPKRNPLSE